MKKLVTVLLLLCMLLVSCNANNRVEDKTNSTVGTEAPTEVQTEAPAPKTILKVMSLNVWGGDATTTTVDGSNKTVDGTIETRSEKLNDLLNGEDIDIAGLQEVRLNWKIWMRRSMDEKYGFVGKSTRDTGEGGYVIYRKDKFTVIESGAFWLVEGAPTTADKHPDSNFDRMCSWVVFQVIETGEYFLFLDTHLDTASETVRTYQASVIVNQIPVLRKTVEENYGYKNCGLILVGDMNAEPHEDTYAVLTAYLRDGNIRSQGTKVSQEFSTSPGFWYCKDEDSVKKNGHYIDHILVTSNISVMNFKMIHTATNLCPYGEYISDHNAMIAEIQLP